MDVSELRDLDPALAGLIIDGEITKNEVTATIIDLINKGYITLKKEKLILSKTDFSRLDDYEIEVLRELFLENIQCNSLDFPQLPKMDFGLLTGLMAKNAIDLGIYSHSSAAQKIKSTKITTDEGKKSGLTFRKVLMKSLAVFLISVVVITILMKLISTYYPNIGVMFLLLVVGLVFGVYILGFLLIVPGFVVLALFKTAEAWDKSITKARIYNIGLKRKLTVDAEMSRSARHLYDKYERLHDFLSPRPLMKKRIYNEFLPFSVAFGLDESWHYLLKKPQKYVVKATDESIIDALVAQMWELAYINRRDYPEDDYYFDIKCELGDDTLIHARKHKKIKPGYIYKTFDKNDEEIAEFAVRKYEGIILSFRDFTEEKIDGIINRISMIRSVVFLDEKAVLKIHSVGKNELYLEMSPDLDKTLKEFLIIFLFTHVLAHKFSELEVLYG